MPSLVNPSCPKLPFTSPSATVKHWHERYLHLSKSKLKADRPDYLNYFNDKHDSGKITSCYAAAGHKLVTSPGIADRYTFLIDTWNTLSES